MKSRKKRCPGGVAFTDLLGDESHHGPEFQLNPDTTAATARAFQTHHTWDTWGPVKSARGDNDFMGFYRDSVGINGLFIPVYTCIYYIYIYNH